MACEPDVGGDTVADREGDGTSGGGLRRADGIVIRERADHLTVGRGAPFITGFASVTLSPSRS